MNRESYTILGIKTDEDRIIGEYIEEKNDGCDREELPTGEHITYICHLADSGYHIGYILAHADEYDNEEVELGDMNELMILRDKIETWMSNHPFISTIKKTNVSLHVFDVWG